MHWLRFHDIADKDNSLNNWKQLDPCHHPHLNLQMMDKSYIHSHLQLDYRYSLLENVIHLKQDHFQGIEYHNNYLRQ